MACLGLISVTGVDSWMVTPRASTAAASPLTSFTGCRPAALRRVNWAGGAGDFEDAALVDVGVDAFVLRDP
jgi:hypothetical protein